MLNLRKMGLDIGAKNPHNGGNQLGTLLMARPRNLHLRTTMKLSLPAPTVARLDLLFEDPLTGKPRYGARSKLIDALLRKYLAELEGSEIPTVPSLEELRSTPDA